MIIKKCTLTLVIYFIFGINEAIQEQPPVHLKKGRLIEEDDWIPANNPSDVAKVQREVIQKVAQNNNVNENIQGLQNAEDPLEFVEYSDSIPNVQLKWLPTKNSKKLFTFLNSKRKEQVESANDNPNEEYIKEFSYNPNIIEANVLPPSTKDRHKRFSDYHYLETDGSINMVDEADEGIDDVDSTHENLGSKVVRKIFDNKVVSTARISESKSGKRNENMDGFIEKYLLGKQSVYSKGVRKGIVSEPKQSVKPSQSLSSSMKNLAELNKAYKLLVCAANRYLKIANKTIMDRLMEECNPSTKGSDSTGSTSDGLQVTCPSAKTTECALESGNLLDQITVRVRKKQGGMSRQQFLSWMRSHVGQNYDTQEDVTDQREGGDDGVYAYCDYEDAEGLDEYEDVGDTNENLSKAAVTNTAAQVSSTLSYRPIATSPKQTKRSRSEQKSDKVQGITDDSPTISVPIAKARSPAWNSASFASSTQPFKVKQKQGKSGVKSRLSRKYRPIAKRVLYGRNIIPGRYLKQLEPGSVTEHDLLQILEGSSSEPTGIDNEGDVKPDTE